MNTADLRVFELDYVALAKNWYALLSPTAYSPYSYEEVTARLGKLARDATDLLIHEPYQATEAERIGVSLAELHYVQGDALGISIKLLSNTWLSSSTVMQQEEKQRQMTVLLGDLANGYFKQAARIILQNQETIRIAQLKALNDLHANLLKQRDLLRISTERLQVLHEIDTRILAAESAEAIVEIAVTHIVDVIPCHSATISLIDFTQNTTTVLASYNTTEELEKLIALTFHTENGLQLLMEGKNLLVNDIGVGKNWPLASDMLHSRGIRSLLNVPLWAMGRLIGILTLLSKVAGSFTEFDNVVARQIADSVAVALYNRNLLETEKAARLESEILRKVTSSLSSSLERQELLDLILMQLEEVVPYDGAVILLEDNGTTQIVASRGFEPYVIALFDQLPPNMQKLMNDREPVLISDTEQYRDWIIMSGAEYVRCWLGVPLKSQNKLIGFLALDKSVPNFYLQSDVDLVQAFADHASIAIENARLYSAVIEERERLARDLHDSATQSLFSLTLFATAAREDVEKGRLDQALQHLEDILYTANQTHREMRLLLYELGRGEAAGEGLVKSLERRLRAVEGRSGISATFHHSGTIELDAEIEQALFYIATEALNNALKYALGTRVEVEIRCENSRVTLSVKDNGVGFDVSEAQRGAGRGLKNMKLRAAQQRGKLSVITAIGQGTKIVASIPSEGDSERI